MSLPKSTPSAPSIFVSQDLTRRDDSGERNTLARGHVVEVRVNGCTFGPHTRTFGLVFQMFMRHKDLPSWRHHIASFIVGRGGNNHRERGTFRVELPDIFAASPLYERVMFLGKAAKKAGIDLSYANRPATLGPDDVYEMFFDSEVLAVIAAHSSQRRNHEHD